MRKFLIYFIISICSQALYAQDDSATLNVEQVLQIVRQYHPTVKQANLQIKKSDAEITIARGAFNPIIGAIVSNKKLENVTYYDYTNPSLTLPTWFGIEVFAGIENLTGNRIDPSETTGESSYIGLSVPLLKNLIIDKRRAYLKQAKLYKDMAVVEQQAIVNNILMEAASKYWEWVNAYQSYKIVENNYEISKQRFEMVKKTFQNGERPAIDTIEAMTQYQTFEFQKNESWLRFLQQGLELSVYLWQANDIPYQLPERIIPQQGWDNESNIQNFNPDLDQLLATAREFHPELQLYDQKLAILDTDKKLKFQELLPRLDFKYNRLSKDYYAYNSEGLWFQNNYQYGFKLEIPALFSLGRGEYKKAKLNIEATQIAQSQKSLTIDLKVKNYFNEFTTLKEQVKLQRSMLSNYEKLLKAEETLFQNGESSLFLINARETKVLESQRKMIELKTYYYKTIYLLQWSAGMLK
ncbi:MAG: TolC family protein [Bacteroidetes bacterium]|nr:TolC family protein [Bacteroidota bacterium]